MLAPADADIVRRDPDLPGLATLLDPRLLVELLRASIDPEIRAAPPRYVRYKPGTKCFVRFDLHRPDSISPAYAIAYRADEKPKSSRKADAIVTDLRISIFVFPNDAEIRSLGRVMDPDRRKKFLRRLFPDKPEWHVSDVRLLAYKPERRAVVQIVGPQGEPRAVVKLYANEDDYVRAARAAKAVPARAKRLARLRKFKVIALRWVRGRPLSEVIGDEIAIRQTAISLARLHQPFVGQLPVLAATAVADSLDASAAELAVLLPEHASRAATLAKRLRGELSNIDAPLVATHGDFDAKQVVLRRNGEAALIDLDEAAVAHGAADIGNFLASLHREGIDVEIGRSLVAAYRAAGGEADDASIDAYTAVALLRKASQPFRDRETDWPAATNRLLDLAERFASPSNIRAKRVAIDPAMPFLDEALDPTAITNALGNTRVVAARLVRHRPGQRCVIEYDVQPSRKSPRETIIGKIRGSNLDEKTYAVIEGLRAAGFDDESADGISVPEPLGVIRPLHMWLQRKIIGESATELLRQSDGVAHARRFAAIAIKLHRAHVPSPRSHSMADELRILHQRLPLVCEIHPQLSDRITKLLAACTLIGESLPPARQTTGIHRDFYADQIVVRGDRLYLIDFDLYCIGDPALDAGNFLAHITEQGLRENQDLSDRETAFEATFIAAYGAKMRARIHLYAALTLARHVYISTRIPSRRGFTQAILDLAERRITELR